MKDTGATRDEKIAARNRANMYQEQIAKLQERTQQIMKNPELKAEAESRMETAVRLLGKMTKAELQQEVVSLRERVNQLKRSYAARADARCKMFLDCLLSPIPSHQDASYFKLTPDRPTQHLAVQPHAPPMNLYFLRIKPPLRVEKSPQPC